MAAVLLPVSVLVILWLTLSPGPGRHRLSAVWICLFCGQAGAANILRNVLLFVPLGVSLGILTRYRRTAWLATLAMTVAIEIRQVSIPGRNPLMIDMVANATGSAIGILFGVMMLGHLADTRRRRWPGPGFLAWTLLAVGAMVGTGLLLATQAPPPPHYVQWTPRLGHLEVYEGELLEARLDGVHLRPGLHPDPAWLTDRLLEGGALELRVIAGPPPPATAPILSVYTAARQELFLLGAIGDDLVVRIPRRAAAFRMAGPDVRFRRALAEVRPGDELRLAFRSENRGRVCLSVGSEERCGLGMGVREGWSTLLFPAGLPGPVRTLVGVGWLLALAVPVGYSAGRAGVALGAGLGLGTVALVVPFVVGAIPTSGPVEFLGLTAGSMLGFVLRRWLSAGFRDEGTHPAKPPAP